MTGLVTPFKGNGRQLGYPTANLTVETDMADGVYFGFADLAAWQGQPAVIFIGTPTTMGDTVRRVEAHLLDIPDQDYYGRELRLSLAYYHRPNQTFATVDQLLAVIKDDESIARQWFAARATLYAGRKQGQTLSIPRSSAPEQP